MYFDIHVLIIACTYILHVFICQSLFPNTAVFNECQTSLHNCDVNAICTDLEQGYTCRCKLGYVGDGLICTDKSGELYYHDWYTLYEKHMFGYVTVVSKYPLLILTLKAEI